MRGKIAPLIVATYGSACSARTPLGPKLLIVSAHHLSCSQTSYLLHGHCHVHLWDNMLGLVWNIQQLQAHNIYIYMYAQQSLNFVYNGLLSSTYQMFIEYINYFENWNFNNLLLHRFRNNKSQHSTFVVIHLVTAGQLVSSDQLNFHESTML